METPHDQPSPQFATELSALYGRAVAVPKALDDAVIAHAHRHAARVRRMRALLRWGGSAAAAAAMLFITLHLIPSQPPVFHPGQRITILDAFSLARQLN